MPRKYMTNAEDLAPDRCVCCDAPVQVFGRDVRPFIEHGNDRVSGGPCPRDGWPVLDAVRTDDDWLADEDASKMPKPFPYGSPVDKIAFTISWYGHDQTKVIGTTTIYRRDLSDAIVAACNMLKSCKGEAAAAHGFYVASAREDGTS